MFIVPQFEDRGDVGARVGAGGVAHRELRVREEGRQRLHLGYSSTQRRLQDGYKWEGDSSIKLQDICWMGCINRDKGAVFSISRYDSSNTGQWATQRSRRARVN